MPSGLSRPRNIGGRSCLVSDHVALQRPCPLSEPCIDSANFVMLKWQVLHEHKHGKNKSHRKHFALAATSVNLSTAR